MLRFLIEYSYADSSDEDLLESQVGVPRIWIDGRKRVSQDFIKMMKHELGCVVITEHVNGKYVIKLHGDQRSASRLFFVDHGVVNVW